MEYMGKTRGGSWLGGYYASKDNKSYIIQARAAAGGEYFECTEIIPETLLKSTKKKDKNGLVIFSGNILQRYKDELVIVNWSDFDAMFNCSLYCMRRKKVIGSAYLCDFQLENYVIIGNIHDNPELIKGAGDK
jgi:hypothetical protein